jgi:aspartate racemase
VKTLGLIGGLTWHSTLEYYRLINQGVAERLGGSHSAQLALYSLDFAPVEKMQDAGKWKDLGRLMVGAARALAAAGAEGIVICANTMHRLADDISRGVSLPIIHIADAAAAAVKKRGLRTVGLLGTRYTMEMEFYKGRLADRHALDVLVPDEQARTAVHNIIYSELAYGMVRGESRRAYLSVIRDLERRGAEGVILGCTEIPLLIRPEDTRIPTFDTTALHAAAAVDFALAD